MRIDQTDLEFISQHLSKKIEKLKKSRTFLTGGFFGKWFIESWIHFNQSFGLNAELLILSRDPALKSFPHLQHPAIKWLKGDVRFFQEDLGTLDYCIHGATSASLIINKKSPFEM